MLKENVFFSYQYIKTIKLTNIKNLKYLNLKGYSYNIIGILIDNKYFFIGDSIISSHIGILSNLLELIDLNQEFINKNIKIILSLINKKIDINYLFLKYLDNRTLKTNKTIYFLYKKTFNSYINYLIKNNLIKFVFENNSIYLIKL